MHVFKFNRNYMKLTIWVGNKDGQLVSTETRTPISGLTRRERYNELADKLREFKIKVPPYEEK